MDLASAEAEIRHVFGDTPITEASIGAAPPGNNIAQCVDPTSAMYASAIYVSYIYGFNHLGKKTDRECLRFYWQEMGMRNTPYVGTQTSKVPTRVALYSALP